jgi:hypothetical protein
MGGHTGDQLYTADCPECQAALTAVDLDADLDKIWAGIAARLWLTPVGRAMRLAGRLPGSRKLARVLALPRRRHLRIRLTLHTGRGTGSV